MNNSQPRIIDYVLLSIIFVQAYWNYKQYQQVRKEIEKSRTI